MKQVVSLVAAVVLALGCLPSFAAEKADEGQGNVMAVVERVNINEADAKAISAALHRVGIKRAEAIVAWREANGKFTSAEQLLEIKGIGQATLESNRDRILF
ncbi:ComEA family DNA-binding protein [Gilvimarinus sp. F26214L]|uniref:ComEA family DNA-binding protein n=1 Tax=Gilvimarinus sp. DZF01 TaxID=3461371 RepID=UPI0040460E02